MQMLKAVASLSYRSAVVFFLVLDFFSGLVIGYRAHDAIHILPSIQGLSLGEGPGAIQYLGTWAIETNQIIPAGRRRQTIIHLAVTATELDRERAVCVRLRRKVVECIGVLRVWLEIAFIVVDAD